MLPLRPTERLEVGGRGVGVLEARLEQVDEAAEQALDALRPVDLEVVLDVAAQPVGAAAEAEEDVVPQLGERAVDLGERDGDPEERPRGLIAAPPHVVEQPRARVALPCIDLEKPLALAQQELLEGVALVDRVGDRQRVDRLVGAVRRSPRRAADDGGAARGVAEEAELEGDDERRIEEEGAAAGQPREALMELPRDLDRGPAAALDRQRRPRPVGGEADGAVPARQPAQPEAADLEQLGVERLIVAGQPLWRLAVGRLRLHPDAPETVPRWRLRPARNRSGSQRLTLRSLYSKVLDCR